jgi:hypothetical protein
MTKVISTIFNKPFTIMSPSLSNITIGKGEMLSARKFYNRSYLNRKVNTFSISPTSSVFQGFQSSL